MTDRRTADTITDDALDALYARAEDAERRAANLQGSYATLTELCRSDLQRAHRAEAERDEMRQRFDNQAQAATELLEERRQLEEQLVTVRSAIDRVRALHQRWDASPGHCAHCLTGPGNLVPWPCPTIQALDGEPQPDNVLTFDRVLTDEEYEEIKTRWNREHGGGRQNHAGPITTGPPAEERPCLCPETGLVNEHMQGCPYEKPQEN